jgi:predicted dehydrogenase
VSAPGRPKGESFERQREGSPANGPDRPLRAGVIGVGHMGRLHAHKYAAAAGVELAAVADRNAGTAERVGAELGVAWHTDHRALLGAVDLVSIAVSTDAHHAVARDCLQGGVHVLVEKPMTETLQQADELIALARARALCLQVGHLERFSAALVALRAEIARPLFIESHRLACFTPRGTEVNVVLDLMIHDIDLVLDLVRSPIVELRASGASVLTDDVDIGNARLEFESGCVANITASRVSRQPMRKLRVFQRDRYLAVDTMHDGIAIARRQPGAGGEPRIEFEQRGLEKGDPLMREVEAFVHAVRSGTAPAVGGEQARRALEVALRISALMRESMRRRT